MKTTKELRIGVSTILILFCTYWGISFLKSSNIFESNDQYHLSLEDATGIVISTSVNVKGVKIGAVNKVQLDSVGNNVSVTVSIKNRYKLPKDSYMSMRQVGIMDAPILEIIPGKSSIAYKNGDTIEFRKIAGMIDLMDNLASQLSSVMSRIDSLAASFQKLASDKNINAISNTLSSLESGTANIDGLLSAQSTKIVNILSNVEQMSESFNSATPEIKEILSNFNNLSDTLNNSVPSMMSELNGLLQKVNSSEGTVGKLIEDDQLYTKIDSLSTTLNTLMQDVMDNPKKYLKFSLWERLTPQQKYDIQKEKERIKELKKKDKEAKKNS